MKSKIFCLLFSCGFLLTSNLIGCSSSQSNPQANSSREVTENALEERTNYDEIDLKTEIPDHTILSGKDPESIAIKAFVPPSSDTESETPIQQTVTVNQDNPNQIIVIITQTGYADDSVRGTRYRVDFEPEQSQWLMVWAGRQYICQPGRGSQNWSSNLCL